MICRDCVKKPTAKGIKEIRCTECHINTEVNAAAIGYVCDECSDRLNICLICGNKEHNRLINMLIDNGNRITYGDGMAEREPTDGKGDMYSLPPAAMLRLSKHLELGTLKYKQRNYLLGIPVSRFMDSALRHLFKYLDGMDDEDHLAAVAFNILGAMQMECRNPEMQDVPERKGKRVFEYGEVQKANSSC